MNFTIKFSLKQWDVPNSWARQVTAQQQGADIEPDQEGRKGRAKGTQV